MARGNFLHKTMISDLILYLVVLEHTWYKQAQNFPQYSIKTAFCFTKPSFSSVQNFVFALTCSFSTISAFLSIFMAYMCPVSTFCTSRTSPKAPLPITCSTEHLSVNLNTTNHNQTGPNCCFNHIESSQQNCKQDKIGHCLFVFICKIVIAKSILSYLILTSTQEGTLKYSSAAL